MNNKTKNTIFVIFLIILIISLGFVITLSSNSESVIQKISFDEISDIMNTQNIIIIDVRTETEYDSGHIPGAINIPDTEIESKINYDKNTPIAVYCRTGKRSNAVANTLKNMGYNKIYDLGGIENSEVKLTKN